MKTRPTTLPRPSFEIAEDTILTCACYPGQEPARAPGQAADVPFAEKKLLTLRVAEKWPRPSPRRRRLAT